MRGVPEHIRSDQGPEFIATWIAAVGAKTAYIEKSSPWENGYVESFNGKLRDELLNVEIFNSLREAPDADRELAPPLQHHPATFSTRLPAACTRDHCTGSHRVAGCATPTSFADHAPAGPTTGAELTFYPDHSVGAGQPQLGVARASLELSTA